MCTLYRAKYGLPSCTDIGLIKYSKKLILKYSEYHEFHWYADGIKK